MDERMIVPRRKGAFLETLRLRESLDWSLDTVKSVNNSVSALNVVKEGETFC